MRPGDAFQLNKRQPTKLGARFLPVWLSHQVDASQALCCRQETATRAEEVGTDERGNDTAFAPMQTVTLFPLSAGVGHFQPKQTARHSQRLLDVARPNQGAPTLPPPKAETKRSAWRQVSSHCKTPTHTPTHMHVTLTNQHGSHRQCRRNDATELAHADMTTLPKVDTSCTALSLIPTVNGNTVRSFSTHGHQSASKGS
jgi:hypothetical protein